jgi:putative oxidoreductase
MAKRTILGDLGLLALRVATGGIMAVHGYPKIFGGPDKPVPDQARQYFGEEFAMHHQHGGIAQTTAFLRSLGVDWAEGAAPAVAFAEFVGGICLILGLYTRFAALLVAADMEEAIRLVHAKVGLIGDGQGHRGYEWPLMILAAAVALLGEGPGRLSIDGLRRAGKKASRQARRARRQAGRQLQQAKEQVQKAVAG